MYTNLKESEFFTKSKYEFINHDFNFEALANLTSKEFADEIEEKVSYSYIKKFTYQEGENHFFLQFYAESGTEKEEFVVIHAYHNKKDYFSINKIDYRTFQKLDINIKLKHK